MEEFVWPGDPKCYVPWQSDPRLTDGGSLSCTAWTDTRVLKIRRDGQGWVFFYPPNLWTVHLCFSQWTKGLLPHSFWLGNASSLSPMLHGAVVTRKLVPVVVIIPEQDGGGEGGHEAEEGFQLDLVIMWDCSASWWVPSGQTAALAAAEAKTCVWEEFSEGNWRAPNFS